MSQALFSRWRSTPLLGMAGLDSVLSLPPYFLDSLRLFTQNCLTFKVLPAWRAVTGHLAVLASKWSGGSARPQTCRVYGPPWWVLVLFQKFFPFFVLVYVCVSGWTLDLCLGIAPDSELRDHPWGARDHMPCQGLKPLQGNCPRRCSDLFGP